MDVCFERGYRKSAMLMLLWCCTMRPTALSVRVLRQTSLSIYLLQYVKSLTLLTMTKNKLKLRIDPSTLQDPVRAYMYTEKLLCGFLGVWLVYREENQNF